MVGSLDGHLASILEPALVHVTKANELQHISCRNLSSNDSLEEEIIGAIKSIYKSFRNSRGGSYLSVTFNTCMGERLRT